MTTLYIRHPAKASVDSVVAGSVALCQFALVGAGGALLQQGAAALGNLTDLTGAAHRVVLLLAASDVTLLRVKIPPLSSARLKAALPNLVEDQLLGDPADCVLAATPMADGMRTVAVVQRAWLEVLVKALLAQGARSVQALPAQMCLPLLPGRASAAISADQIGLELTLRLAQYDGFGLTLALAPAAALETLRALAGDVPLTVYVAANEVAGYQALAAGMSGITLEAEHWAHWVAGAHTAAPDLIPALGASGAQARNWQRWRWPVRLALLALLVNIVGVNIEWLRFKREAAGVRLAMLQTFKAAYPKETVILDPAAQMRKNIARAQLESGQRGPDEFTALCAAFGEAMGSLARQNVIAALEYREQALFIKLKPGTLDAAAMGQIRVALAAHNLALLEPTPGTWQIRSSAGAKS